MLYLVALRYKGHSSFCCGDVIAITSWAPDVVNLVRPISQPIGILRGKVQTRAPRGEVRARVLATHSAFQRSFFPFTLHGEAQVG